MASIHECESAHEPFPLGPRLTPEEFIRKVFSQVEPSELVITGVERHGPQQDEPYVHWWNLVPVEEAPACFNGIFAMIPSGASTFISFDTRATSCSRQAHAAIMKAATNGKPLHFDATAKHVRSMTAVVVDFDVGRAHTITRDEAICRLQVLVSTGAIPAPSLVAKSPRGLYFVYLLRDQQGRAPLMTSATCTARREIIKAISERCGPDLKVDLSSGYRGKYFRSPQSVEYRMWLPMLQTYDLTDLHRSVGAPPRREPTPSRIARARRVGEPAGRRRNWKAVAAPSLRRMAELEAINRKRGGIAQGFRHRFLFFYGPACYRVALAQTGDASMAGARAVKAAYAINETFRPPLARHEVIFALRSDARIIATNLTIAEALEITPEEVADLALTSLIPSCVASERKHAKAEARAERERLRGECDALLFDGSGVAEVARLTGLPYDTVKSRAKLLRVKPNLSTEGTNTL